jgi:large subunit ribosomal protein L9
VHELLIAEGVEVDRRRIELKEPIKEAGEHTVPVKLHRDVVAQLQVHVVPEE